MPLDRFAELSRMTALAITVLFSAPALARAQTMPTWSAGGADIQNTRSILSPKTHVGTDTQIRPTTLPKLALKWKLTTPGGISATPTVEPGGLYVPDAAGFLYKVNPSTGAVIWKHNISDYTGLFGSRSRSSPAIGGNVVVIGDNYAHKKAGNLSQPGARVIAVDKATGNKVWTTIIDTADYAQVLGSPTIYDNLVYVGTASWEEGIAASDAHYVPKFRGSVTALDLRTGAIVWQFKMVPPGYTGGAVPGTSPVVWTQDNALIVGTGNNYTIPASVGRCIAGAKPNLAAMTACLDPTDYVNSIVSLDLKTGKLKWARRMSGPDTWTMACQATDPAIRANCPYGPSNDYDFASHPNLVRVKALVGQRDDLHGTSDGWVLGAGQKSGVYWGVNPNNGGVYWAAMVAPGGIEWGSAIDGENLNYAYVATNNPRHRTNALVGRNGKPATSTGGSYAAVDLGTGAIKWQVPAYGKDRADPHFTGSSQGPVTFTNFLIFAGSSSGYFSAYTARSGLLIWSFDSGDNVASGPAVFNDTVFWGTGFKTTGSGKPTLFAFSIKP